ncbi:hypothetical protein J3F84DRAFT_254989 [Trichoderma pleuroticola]
MQYREVVHSHWQSRSIGVPLAHPQTQRNPTSARMNMEEDRLVTLKPQLDLELNGNGNSPSPLCPLVLTSPCACLLAPLLYEHGTVHITPAGMWPSRKQDLSPAADWGSKSRLGMPCSGAHDDVPCLFCGEASPSPRRQKKKDNEPFQLSR